MQPLQEITTQEQTSDNMLLDWQAVKCTAEIQQALDPHKNLLLHLADMPPTDPNFSKPDVQLIPALQFKPPQNFPTANPTFLHDGLLDTDLAGVQNWFYKQIGGKVSKMEAHHLLHYAIAHARTLLLAD